MPGSLDCPNGVGVRKGQVEQAGHATRPGSRGAAMIPQSGIRASDSTVIAITAHSTRVLPTGCQQRQSNPGVSRPAGLWPLPDTRKGRAVQRVDHAHVRNRIFDRKFLRMLTTKHPRSAIALQRVLVGRIQFLDLG